MSGGPLKRFARLWLSLGLFSATIGGVSSAAVVSRCGDPAVRAWCNVALTADQRAALLLGAMTLDEKITLLAGDTGTAGPVTGSGPHTGASFAIPRLGIPVVYYSDGPVGPRQGSATAMPIPMALAATFGGQLARNHGAEIAGEAKSKGNDVIFAPTVNLMRTPEGGRTYEAYGEDPFLVASTTVGWIDGAQSTGVIADVKHFLANNQEGQIGVPPVDAALGGRQTVDANIDERTLREVYMPQFEAAVKQANVGTVMCAYNRVNGPYACENSHTMQQVLEKEWGFKGYVLADYGAAKNTVGDLNNGLDFEPWPAIAYSPTLVRAALTSGLVKQKAIDDHILRILRTMFAYGIFDRAAYPDSDAQIDKAADAGVAERIEESAITLLKNQGGLLPLDSRRLHSIAVIGPYADRFVTGGGSGSVKPFAVTTPLKGITSRAGPGASINYDDGSNLNKATADAKKSDVAVVVVGDVQSEGQDKSCLGLNCASDVTNAVAESFVFGSPSCPSGCPPNGFRQSALISAVAAANAKTIVVLETGGPVLTPWRGQVPGILEAWYPGQEGGTAIARVLFGDVDPGGRLPVTFPKTASQLQTYGNPLAYPGVADEEFYSEGVFVGYRWYDAHGFIPAFPFGYGLSFTTFRYTNLQIAAGVPGTQSVATVSVDVTNAGARTGTAVPQLYIGSPTTMLGKPQPIRELKGFERVTLAPGQTARVTFSLNDRSFAYYESLINDWRISPGCYQIEVGSSDRDLPLRGFIGRGGSLCGGGDVSLGVQGSFFLPLPAEPAID